jgi:predicted acylesterase/phospholipase RssA
MGTTRENQAAEVELPVPWCGPLAASEFLAFLTDLLEAEAGRLRIAKNYAWYLAVGRGRKPRVTAGLDDWTLWMLFWDALISIDEASARRLEKVFNQEQSGGRGAEPIWCKQLLVSVLEVYYCQTAIAMSPKVRDEWDALPLADAVAASAAFPPLFPPFQLHDIYDDLHVQVLSLTDGGPFDNIGVTALLDEHCNYVIVSDTGAVFNNRQSKSAVGRLGMMRRLSEMLMNRPAQLYRHDLNERRRLGRVVEADSGPPSASSAIAQFIAARELKGLALFDIGSKHSAAEAPAVVDPTILSSLRTDLDVFGDVEINCLVNAGYIISNHYINEGLKHTPFGPLCRGKEVALLWEKTSMPFPMPLDKDKRKRVEYILKVGKLRFFRALMLGAPLSILVTVIAAAGLLITVKVNAWEWTDAYAAINWVVAKLLTWDILIASLQSIPLLLALTILLLLPAIGLCLKLFSPLVSRGVQYTCGASILVNGASFSGAGRT